jgi:hypothetical protein
MHVNTANVSAKATTTAMSIHSCKIALGDI